MYMLYSFVGAVFWYHTYALSLFASVDSDCYGGNIGGGVVLVCCVAVVVLESLIEDFNFQGSL